MFLSLDKKDPQKIAVIDDSGLSVTYGELHAFAKEFYKLVQKRSLVFILCENRVGALAAYVACLQCEIVPLLLSKDTDESLLKSLISTYSPAYIWASDNFPYSDDIEKASGSYYGFSLFKTGLNSPELHPELSLLLSTSGSTGSPKLVRHSYQNVTANARNVAKFFELDGSERPIAILPIQYTMGLSVVSSHLFAGSTILLCSKSLTNPEFWSFIKEQKATSFTGVPYSYEILYKLRFFRMDLPHLRVLSQGGGKLSEKLFKAFADHADEKGIKFIATYGQTEGTARMAFLPSEKATAKTCSIGGPIPEGQLLLIDTDGSVIEDRVAEGEMVYRGPNVTMGYARTAQDLTKGDENNGELRTGDIARRDEDGDYFIIGRMNRFLKLYGLRIGLGDIESLVKEGFETDCYCAGSDSQLEILITSPSIEEEVKKYIGQKTGLFHKAIRVTVVDSIKRNEAGKVIQ
jgi:acyl-coenzyme A synthetase/AMP-(fatty) acid ligase